MKASLLFSLLVPFSSLAGVELSGRLSVPDTNPPVMLSAVRAFGFPSGSATGNAFRSWEMEPRGWWKLDGPAGNWNVFFTGPAHFMRPVLLQAKLDEGAKDNHLKAVPHFDFACFTESAWDTKPARAYWQPFTAKSTSVTHLGFKLATDGVDGPGPGSQTVEVGIYRCTDGKPETWPQVGPASAVINVDCGGAKSYYYSCGWHSGEVELQPGNRYAVKLNPAKPTGVFQAFWEKCEDKDACFRSVTGGEATPAGHRLWMSVSGDGDGLVLPCNKKIHREFGDFAGFTTSWTQSWCAKGSSLAGLMLYTATSGTQPRMEQQRIAVRIHRDRPNGPIISPEKVAAACANYTGDASWGVIGAVFGQGEAKLTPGDRYFAEFTTLETPDTIGNFVNFKKQVNDRKPGFNPYFRHEYDVYADGEAWKAGKEKVARDLDLQVVEYAVPNVK